MNDETIEQQLFELSQQKIDHIRLASMNLTQGVFLLGVQRLYRLRAGAAKRMLHYALFLESAAQHTTPLGQTHATVGVAIALGNAGRTRDALAKYERAVSYFVQVNDLRRLVTMKLHMLPLFNRLGEYETAIALAKEIRLHLQAEWLHDDSTRPAARMVELERQIGLTYLLIGETEQALACFQHGVELAERIDHPYSVGILYINTGRAYMQLDDFATAETYFHKAVALFSDIADSQELARSSMNLAELTLKKGDTQQTLAYLQQARDGFVQVGQAHEVAYADHLRAVAYQQLGLFVEARQMATDAANVLRTVQTPYFYAEAVINIAESAFQLADFAEAERELDRARRVYRKLGATLQIQLIDVQRAENAFAMGKVTRAQRIAKRLEKEVAGSLHPSVGAKVQLLLARCAWTQGRENSAETHRQAAQAVAAQHSLHDILSACHHLRGEMLENSATENLTAAHQAYQAAVQIIEKQRQNFSLDDIHIGYMERKLPIYHDLLRIAHQLAITSGAFDELLNAINLTLSAPLAQGESIEQKAHLTEQERLQLAELRDKWRWQQNKLEGQGRADGLAAPVPINEAALLDETQQTERAIAEILRQQRIRGGGGRSREQGVRSREEEGGNFIAALRRGLDTKTAQLIYYVVEEKLHLLAVTREEVRLFADLVAESGIDRLLKAWRFHIENVAAHGDVLNPAVAQAYTRRFYAALVGAATDLINQKSHLQIITPPAWHALPFAAFYDGANYLAETHTLTYLAKPQAQTHYRPIQQGTALIVANTDNGRLHNTVDEAAAVASIAAEKFTIEKLLGEAATSDQLIAASQNSSLIHLATHALFRVDNPYFSWVRLQDRRVPVVDLYAARLEKQPLVVLSACETGRGKPQGGGVIGVGRGFLVAGAASVLFSLWSQSDETTPALMQDFYRAWLKNANVGQALRAAQLAAIEKQLHPFHWAGFTYLSA